MVHVRSPFVSFFLSLSILRSYRSRFGHQPNPEFDRRSLPSRHQRSTLISCSLSISPKEVHSATQVSTHFPSPDLTSKPPDQTTRSLNSRREQLPDELQELSFSSFSAQTLIVLAVSFHSSGRVFSSIFAKSRSQLSDFVLLLCIICQMFALELCGLSISCSHEHMYSSSSLHKLLSDSHARPCASSTFCCISSKSSRAALSSSLSLRSCFNPFLILVLVPSIWHRHQLSRLWPYLLIRHGLGFIFWNLPCNF